MARGPRDFGSLRELRAQLKYWSTCLLIELAAKVPNPEQAGKYAKKAASYGAQLLLAGEAYGKS